MEKHAYRRILARIEEHYTDLLNRYGDTPEGAQWRSCKSREARFRVLADIGVPRDAKVLDLGCGTGSFLEYLRTSRSYEGEYVGWDVCEAALRVARKKFPGTRFERKDILGEGVREEFDYVFVCGTFNNDNGHNDAMMRESLRLLYRHTRRGLAFNVLSAWAGNPGPGLYCADPADLFDFCHRHLSPLVTVRHDYRVEPGGPPSDFAVYIMRG